MGLYDFTFYDVISRNAVSFCNRPAWFEARDGRALTFGQFKETVDRMACGLQMYQLAFTVTAFIYILLYLLEFSGGSYQFKWALRVDSTDPVKVENVFLSLVEENKFHILRVRKSKEMGRFRCSFRSKVQFDTDVITKEIRDRCGDEVHFTRFEWDLDR